MAAPIPETSSPFQAIQDAIYTTLESEMPAGNRLAGVKAVGNAWLNEVNIYPYVYCDFDSFDEDLGDALHQRKQTIRYVIGIAYESEISLSDARTQVKKLLDDGVGNGVAPILRDPSHYLWGQNIRWSTINQVKMFDNGTNNQNTSGTFVAYVTLVYTVNTAMTIPGALQ